MGQMATAPTQLGLQPMAAVLLVTQRARRAGASLKELPTWAANTCKFVCQRRRMIRSCTTPDRLATSAFAFARSLQYGNVSTEHPSVQTLAKGSSLFVADNRLCNLAVVVVKG